MEKLELKHLAPYLPYGLKVSQPRHGKNEAYLLYGLKYSDYAKEWTVFIDDSRHGDYQNVYLKGVKPILRPLSDLTKEITHNGEKFIPIDYFVGDDSDLVYNACLIHNDFSYLPYNLVQLLLEWHFDVFGLIEQGLAIDINTL